MTNKDFAVATTKFLHYANNYPSEKITYPSLGNGMVTEYQPDFFQAFKPHKVEELLRKFKYWYKRFNGKSGACLIQFFAELDGNNRARMLKWINENYNHGEDYGINLKIVE